MVLPIAFMFLLGIVWFGRAFNIYSTITQAAQQGAVAAARSTCVSCGNNATNDGAVVRTVSSVLQASHLDPGQIPTNSNPPTVTAACSPLAPPPTCNTSSNITICRSVILNPNDSADPAQCGAIVSFQYPFQFYLPFTSLNNQRIVLTAQSQSRMEN